MEPATGALDPEPGPMPPVVQVASGERSGLLVLRQSLGPAIRSVLLPFWRSRASLRSWLAVVAIGLCLYGEVRLALSSTRLVAVLTQGALDKASAVVWSTLTTIVLVVGMLAITVALVLWLKQFVMIEWRRWLTARVRDAWLADDAFYRLERDGGVDNADQRVSEDCLLAVRIAVTMAVDLVTKVAQITGFAAVLWTMGGAQDLRGIGIPVSIPGGMVWAAILFQGVGSALTLWLGYALIRLTVARQRTEADLRFAMTNLRIHAEQIALYGGERAEDARLRQRFADVVTNWHRIMGRNAGVFGLSGFLNQMGPLLAMVLAWERFFDGRLNYGELFVLQTAFMRITYGLNWLIFWFSQGDLYTWLAALRRLDALGVDLARPAPHGVAIVPTAGEDTALATRDLRLARPDGSALTYIGDRRFAPGERWLVQGASGVGKSSMIRALAGLWPYGAGEVRRDDAAPMLFLPQKSYVPEGSLFDALCYPSPPGRFTPDACADALGRVRLGAFADRLHEQAAWQQRLSPGEQQRLAFARILLQRPAVILLDEATSALDSDTERHLYDLLDRELPDATVVSIGHRETLERFHPHRLTLFADGGTPA